MRIAIDGPAGAGKSTIARRVAAVLGYVYVDTGAMYRALTAEVLRRSIEPEDAVAVSSLAKSLQIMLRHDNKTGQQGVLIDHRDVTEEIREPVVNQNVSMVASHEGVRTAIVAQQKSMAAQGNVVMDGRDIGTTVIPDAEVKVFLKASVRERARRRSLDLIRRGYKVNLDELEDEIRERDFFDSTRRVSPLRKADDAVEIDTTHVSVDEVVDMVLLLCQGREATH